MQESDTNSVSITDCKVPICNLKKNTTVSIKQIFVPNQNVDNVVTMVYASLFILRKIPMPFYGVNGYDACPNIKRVSDNATGCPLQKGIEYVYSNSFPIYQIYPLVRKYNLYVNHNYCSFILYYAHLSSLIIIFI